MLKAEADGARAIFLPRDVPKEIAGRWVWDSPFLSTASLGWIVYKLLKSACLTFDIRKI